MSDFNIVETMSQDEFDALVEDYFQSHGQYADSQCLAALAAMSTFNVKSHHAFPNGELNEDPETLRTPVRLS